ncbi:MAG TPA: hypothetical protein VFZ64_08920 [Nocardioidaceae bacterium]
MSTPRTHPLNVSYLVVGLVFLGIAASWALRETGVVDLSEVRWLLPLTLVVAGLVGVAAMMVKGLRSHDHTPSGHDYDEADDYYEGDAR